VPGKGDSTILSQAKNHDTRGKLKAESMSNFQTGIHHRGYQSRRSDSQIKEGSKDEHEIKKVPEGDRCNSVSLNEGGQVNAVRTRETKASIKEGGVARKMGNDHRDKA